jgi:hypothetical protein
MTGPSDRIERASPNSPDFGIRNSLKRFPAKYPATHINRLFPGFFVTHGKTAKAKDIRMNFYKRRQKRDLGRTNKHGIAVTGFPETL